VRLARLCVLAVLLLPVFGCGGQKAAEDETIKTTAPINNNAPEAKNAPAAPHDPSIIMPGGGKKGAPPPPGN
jgi:hypothetical protein